MTKRDAKEFCNSVGSAFDNGNEAYPYTLLLKPDVSVGEEIVFSLPKAKGEAESI